MTAAQERRLLHAALGFVGADAVLQVLRRDVKAGKQPDPDGAMRLALLTIRYRWKQKLIRAAGLHRKQPLLPLEKTERQPKAPKVRPMYGPRSPGWRGARISFAK